jgi:hypothetical protein
LVILDFSVLLSTRPYRSGARRSGAPVLDFVFRRYRLLAVYTNLAAVPPHAVGALQSVVHQDGSDLAATEAVSLEHAAIKTYELGLYPAEVTRKESREGFLHHVEKTGRAGM